MNKRGIELSINFIVTLILAIVILSFGIYFIKLTFEKSIQIKETLDQQTEMELERLLDSGEKVSIYPGRRDVNAGEMAVFGLGILNVGNTNKNFKISVVQSTGIGIANCDECTAMIGSKIDSEDVSIELNNKLKKKIGILTKKGTASGTYVFDVKVCYDGSSPSNGIDCIQPEDKYGDLKKIYVKVR